MSGYDITSVVDMYLTRDPAPAEIHAVIVAALDPDPRSAAVAMLELSEKLIDQLHPGEFDLERIAPGTRGWAFAYDGRFVGVPYRETKYPKTLAIHTAIYVILTSLKK
jgi:hypothetical protein|nr:MAG TPA: hypothetical protein [Caudoviricetes sp.]